MDIQSEVYNLKRLFVLREAAERLDLSAPPTARVLYPQTLEPSRRVGILCGSFNPLTLAHTELAERALTTFQLDSVLFTLAKVTVDKEQMIGMGLEDRLLLLALYTQQHSRLGVALVNRGLYFEQAQAFRAFLEKQVELSFLIGMDKLIQILDPRYYQDRDIALDQLFSLASLMVANRADMDEASFLQLLDQPENRPYRPTVRFFSLPTTITDLSATAVREALSIGQSTKSQVPEETRAFVSETRAYHSSRHIDKETVDTYALRLKLLASLYTARSWAEQEVDFRHLLYTALSASEEGRALRHASRETELLDLVRSLPLRSVSTSPS